ncbi:MAG: chemotaxis response regulator protein-glutamate methylesterase [Thioploca sp.]|nr:chemotaxis response regulator protein-glutamate methylesterase [Thioploca sp.]
MRIGIVNHLVAEILWQILAQESSYKIAWIARDGAQAVAQCIKNTPDLVLMELSLPVMNGVEATRRIMKKSPCPILIVTTTVDKNTAQVFEAMGYGALDAVDTPLIGHNNYAQRSREIFLKKIKMIAKLHTLSSLPHLKRPAPLTSLIHQTSLNQSVVPHLIAIGSSTGGPNALAELLANLPNSLPATLVIIQHVNQEFSVSLAAWLNVHSALPVQLALNHQQPQVGTVYLASSNDHLILTKQLTFAYTADPHSIPYRPSVDVFFQSVAKHWPQKSVAVLLTGMGRDGAEGLALLRTAGWYTIAQDEATSVVYGMPKAAKERGAATDILPLGEISKAIIYFLQGNRLDRTNHFKLTPIVDSPS